MQASIDQTKPGRNGLLATLLIVAVAPSIGSLAGLWIFTGAIGSTIYAICKAILYGVPAVVAWRSVTRTDVRIGLRAGMTPSVLLWGFASGAAIGSGIVLLWFGWLDSVVDTDRLLVVMKESGLEQPSRYWLFAAWLILGNSLLEEFVFRWFVDSRLAGLGMRPLLAIPLSALVFTIHHVIVLAAFFDLPMVLAGSAGVFVGGLLWSWSLRGSKSLVPGWISHALVDLAIALVGASMLGLI